MIKKIELELIEMEGKVFVNFAQLAKVLLKGIYGDVPPPPPPPPDVPAPDLEKKKE